MHLQGGFTLFELMIAITVIAIMAALGVPAYQRYIQKAAMTNMLQMSNSYKIAVELCALEIGKPENCNNEQLEIPAVKISQYIDSVEVKSGIITIKGKSTLNELTVTLTPSQQNSQGMLIWTRTCHAGQNNQSLIQSCESVLKA